MQNCDQLNRWPIAKMGEQKINLPDIFNYFK